MSHTDSRFWNNSLQSLVNQLNVGDSIMHKEYLSSSFQFAQNGFADQLIVGSVSPYCTAIPVLRRSFQIGNIANTHQRHVQRSGNRCRRHRQNINFCPDRFKRSLCSTPNFCSSSIIINPGFLNLTSRDASRCVPITMSTLPAANLAMFTLFSRSAKPAELGDIHRKLGHPFRNVSKCWSASTVVGTRTATW